MITADRIDYLPHMDGRGKTKHRPQNEQEFWGYVEDMIMPIPECGCMVWTGSLHRGYGVMFHAGRHSQVHRLVFERERGPIPAGLQLDHLCRVRSCCNPAHLEAVTPRVNTLRGLTITAHNTTKTHCPEGHALVPSNLLAAPLRDGKRACRTCHRERAVADRKRRRAAILLTIAVNT